jgi:NADPH-dependent 2,4-dienoyl-CoA reductase/sulfur reductase-like enzyme
MAASQADIFAAGDVAEVYDPSAGRTILNSLWRPARQQGRVAGMNMAGCRAKYRSELPCNVTRLAGLTTTIIGMVGSGEEENLVCLARGDSEAWRLLPDALAAESHSEVNHLRLLIGQETLLGAVVIGDQSLSQPLQEMVAAQTDIRPIRSQLLETSEGRQSGKPDEMAQVLIQFWSNWRELHAGAPAGAVQ